MSECLPLCEYAFRALEDAYERQWQQAHALQQQQQKMYHTTMADATSRSSTTHRSACVAAAEMHRLLTLTRQLHTRFVAMRDGAGPRLSSEEFHALKHLGFDTAAMGISPPISSLSTSTPTRSPGAAGQHNGPQKAGDTAAVMSVLRHENAQLLSALAWYRLRESATATATATGEEELRPSRMPAAARSLAELRSLQGINAALCHSHHGAASPPPPPVADESAVDVALRDLLRDCGFPRGVHVDRIPSSRLYVLDRPVGIVFAAPGSSRLVVRDPEALEADTDLRAYIMQLYEPLLRALRWRPPATLDASQTEPAPSVVPSGAAFGVFTLNPCEAAAASHHTPRDATPSLAHMSDAELLALKRVTLHRLGHDSSAAAGQTERADSFDGSQ